MIRVKGLGRGLVVAYALFPIDFTAHVPALDPAVRAHSRAGTLEVIVYG
jgi:hypothetical protein